ncbi:unnamed protein product [Caenorhabditis auriculariae]|uniref:Uncharacterized protein n=1 Tax=Caenorhabditis auriculariae TaxID=2777116 RepID=A0A8S1H3B3_9PELO|nr:unnamed protein product [Caenorhabditis auriculariae]
MIAAGVAATLLIALSTIYWHNSKKLTFARTVDDRDSFYDVIAPPHSVHEILHNSCKWPIFSPFEPDLQPFLETRRTRRCTAKSSVRVTFDDDYGTILISTVDGRDILCKAVNLPSNEEQRLEFEIPLETKQNVPFENFLVECHKSGKLVYSNPFVNFAARKPRNDFNASESSEASLAILTVSSASYSEILRKLPKSLDFMRENRFISYSMLSKVESSPEENFERTFGASENGKTLWDSMKDRGCVTLTNKIAKSSGIPQKSLDFDLSSWKSTNSLNDCNATPSEVEVWKKILVEIPRFVSFFADGNGQFREFRVGRRRRFEKCPRGGQQYQAESRSEIHFFHDKNPGKKVRRVHPEHFRNLLENSNRLATNADVALTLRDLAENRFPEIIPARKLKPNQDDFDELEEDHEAHSFSLIQTILWEKRSCEQAGIREDLCLCMVELEDRSELMDNTSDEYNTLYEMMQKDILEHEKCVVETTTNELLFPTVRTFQLNDAVLGVNTSNPVPRSVEFYELGIRGLAPKPSKRAQHLFFDALGRFRNYIMDQKIEKASPFVIVFKNEFCLSQRLDESPRLDGFCEMCYDKLLLTPSRPNTFS